MATEFPDDPEVDLGFRDPDPELPPVGYNEKTPQAGEQSFVAGRSRTSPAPLSAQGWLLRILLVIAFSACGGLISSIFFFNVPERFTVLRHLVRETYILPPAENDERILDLGDLRIDRVPTYKIGNAVSEGVPELKDSEVFNQTVPPLPEWLPHDDLFGFVQNASPFSSLQNAPVSSSIFSSAVMLVSKNRADLTSETPNGSAVRSAIEKGNERKAATQRRLLRHVVRKTRPRPSFWSIWSRRFLASGTAVTTRRRSSKRDSRNRKAKQSFWLASSWRAIASQGNQRKDRTKSVSRSRPSVMQNRSRHQTTRPR